MLERVQRIVDQIEYKPGYRLLARREEIGGRIYIQVECERPDSYTGELGVGRGGKLYLSPWMVDGEIVRKAFQAYLSYEEHECREFFKYRDARVFGPHIDIDALVEVADRLETR